MSKRVISNHELQMLMSFYDWYESAEGKRATLQEKLKRASDFVKYVLMEHFVDQLYPGMKPAERRRVYRLNLAEFNHCIRADQPLPARLRPQHTRPSVPMDTALVDSI